jgi:hypothetical protein
MENLNQNFSNFSKQLEFSNLVVKEIASFLNRRGILTKIKRGVSSNDLIFRILRTENGKMFKSFRKVEIKQNLKALARGFFYLEFSAIWASVEKVKVNGEINYQYKYTGREIWFVGFWKDSKQEFYLCIFRSPSTLIKDLFIWYQKGDNKEKGLNRNFVCEIPIPLIVKNLGLIKIRNQKLIEILKEYEKNGFDFSIVNNGIENFESLKKLWREHFGVAIFEYELPKLVNLFEPPTAEISEKLKF